MPMKVAEAAGAIVVFVVLTIIVSAALEVVRREFGWEPVGRLVRLVPSLPRSTTPPV